MSKKVRIDFYVILGIIFLSLPIIIYFHTRPLTSALFFFLLPTIYLFWRKKKPIKEVVCGALLIGGAFGFIFDVVLSANNAWNEVTSQLVFNYRIFGFWPADEPIWFILWALFIIVFYEHFYEKDRKDKLSKKYKYILTPALIVLFLVLTTAFFNKKLLLFPYTYFILALPTLIPIVYVLEKRPNLIIKFIKTSIFFFMLYLVYELTAVKLGQWYFPGEYIGQVKLLGIQFPFEELFFWMTLSSFAVLSIYEGFVDNNR